MKKIIEWLWFRYVATKKEKTMIIGSRCIESGGKYYPLFIAGEQGQPVFSIESSGTIRHLGKEIEMNEKELSIAFADALAELVKFEDKTTVTK